MNVVERLVAERNAAITAALRASVAPTEPWRLSMWNAGLCRSHAVDPECPGDGGTPVTTLTTSATELSKSLEEYAPTYVGAKDLGNLLLSYATHVEPERGGHKDEDCATITGLILDCDVPKTVTDWERLAKVLVDLGLSFTLSLKPSTGKFHVIVQIKTLVVPRDKAPKDKLGPVRYGYAREHQSLFSFAIARLSDLAGATFDPAMAPILMHIDFPACRKTESDPMPLFDGHDGGVLDIEKFCEELGYQSAPVQKRPKPVVIEMSDAKKVTAAELREQLEKRARGLTFRGYNEKTFKHGESLKTVLAGRPLVLDGKDRNGRWYREVIGTCAVFVSQRYPNIEVEDLASLLVEIFTPALEVQHTHDMLKRLDHMSPRDADHLENMFCRSMRDIRAKEEREKATAEAGDGSV